MGGSGSGRPGWRPLAEQSKRLVIGRYVALLRRLDDPRVVTAQAVERWTWSHGGGESASILVIAERGPWGPRIRLRYKVDDTPVEEVIEVLTTTPNYGGRRWWWQCPRCYRRVGVLFAPGSRWRCRHCWRITYTSSNESHQNDVLARMLGCDPGILRLIQQRNRGDR